MVRFWVCGLMVLSACVGPPAVCDSKSCAGCCSANECHVGSGSDFCGTGGLSCSSCAIDQICRVGVCLTSSIPPVDAGTRDAGGTSFDAGVADAGGEEVDAGVVDSGVTAIDSGVVDSGVVEVDSGVADSGVADSGVADSGTTVVDAGPGPSCSPSNCDGCCNGNVCQRGDSTTMCGAHGNACIQCGDGLICSDGSCKIPSCSSSSCPNGCCQNNLCVTPTQGACGTGGQICAACAGGQVCDQGHCATATCGLTSCNGCCQNNTCVSPTRPNACGFSGNACTNCAEGQSCGNGSCGLTGNRYAGSPCTEKADCQIGGTFGNCNTGSQWPGGYCQDTCFILSCHSPDLCIDNNCYERCDRPRQGQDTCRGGYLCESSQPDGGLAEPGRCVPDCFHRACSSGICDAQGYCSR